MSTTLQRLEAEEARAEEMIARLASGESNPSEGQTPPALEPQDSPAASGEPAPEGQADTPPATEPQPGTESSQTEQPPMDAAPEPQAAPDASSQPDPWEEKFRSLQARFRSEMDRKNARILELEGQLRSVDTRQPAPSGTAKPASEKPAVVDPKAFEDFGPDVVKLAEVVNVLAAENEAIKTRNQELETKLEPIQETVKTSAERTFYGELAQAVPNWREIDRDPEFLDWLADVNPYDPKGRTRMDALRTAQANGNARTVAQLFKDYSGAANKPGAGTASPAATPPAAPQAPAPKPAPTNVQPARSRTGNATAPAQKPILSRAEIARFYEDVRTGRFVGTDADIAKKEREIALASKEGRVQ